MHPHRPIVMHVDFQRVKATEKLHMNVPLHFEGADDAPGVKVDGGILSYLMTEFDITCLPKDLPEYISVNVSNLGINESIHLSEVTLPEGVEFTSSSAQEGDDPTVATITPPKIIEEEEVVEEGDEALGDEAEDAGEEGVAQPADSGTKPPESPAN